MKKLHTPNIITLNNLFFDLLNNHLSLQEIPVLIISIPFEEEEGGIKTIDTGIFNIISTHPEITMQKKIELLENVLLAAKESLKKTN